MAPPPPPKVVTHHYQLANYNLGMTISLLVLNIFAVVMRLLARKKQRMYLQMDDWLTVAALVRIMSPALSRSITDEYFSSSSLAQARLS